MKTYNTAVVVIPPQEVWPPIQAIREQHDRQIRRWMPHITMLYPFRPREEFPVLAERFAAVCAQQDPFPITLATFRSFQHARQRYTLWLAPEPKEPLVQLQTLLWQVVPDCDDVRRYRGGFTPHLSVGQAQGEAASQLLSSLQETWQPVTFLVDAVSLIWRDSPPDDVFRVGQVIRLGS
ncbi:MAG: 2'-5' RNA ligase family protein [Nitrospinota bacterium]|nr:MAG: 2'-5' RNA ligase family protein [Nitrospinota bacterium]